MTLHRVELSVGVLTRVGYVDVSIPPDVAGLTAQDLDRVPWREPLWCQGDQLRAGAAVWAADLSGTRLVFDPLLATDDVLRSTRSVEKVQQDAIARLLEDSGFPRESVDGVALSHVEGVGMVAWRDDAGAWTPFFPNATILVSDVNLEALRRSPPEDAPLQHEAWAALLDQGVVRTYTDGDPLAPGLHAEVSGGHCAGHSLLHLGPDPEAPEATLIGHLAISPLHLTTGEKPDQHESSADAWRLLCQVRPGSPPPDRPPLARPRLRSLARYGAGAGWAGRQVRRARPGSRRPPRAVGCAAPERGPADRLG